MGRQELGPGQLSRIPPPPPGFRLDLPPPPAGFVIDEPDEEPRPKQTKDQSKPPALSLDRITRTVDGDTLGLGSGRNLRLWGVDAPELRQQGYDRHGVAVPIGERSRTSLADIALGRRSRIGDPVSMSFGRPVAPVTVDGMDVGQRLARYGNALAAPKYLGSDPERRFDYMQAERLARQNRLGMHSTMYQPPAEYRKSPASAPSRGETARFWDTPTPFAGMRPEVEKRYIAMLNDRSVTPAEVAAYAKANGGFIVDPAEVSRARKAAGDQPIGMYYTEPPRVLTDLDDGRTGATVRGVGSGVLAGGFDEAGAVADTFGLTPGRENIWNSDRRLADIWQNNQRQNAAILGHDEYAHPGYRLGGQLAGGLLVPFGAKARTVPQLFRVGAAYGGAEGFLGTEGDIGQRAIGGAIGVPVGGALGAVGGKALEVAAPYLGRAYRRVTGRNPPSLDDVTNGEVPPPPEGFTLDTPPVRTQAMETAPSPSVSAPVRQPDYLFAGRPQRLDQPMTETQLRAAAENVDPRDVLPIPSNVVGDVDEAATRDAGRIVEARAPNERGELTRRTVRAWNGAEVPKAGPIDMVGWLRLQGGLADQGGELSHMGLTNTARKMDFAGQEQRFGPLVSPEGMNLDDAAMRAWEAGYFPDHAERPTVNAFLDALRDTYEGRSRRFLPEDLGEIERFNAARGERYDLEQRRFETGEPIYRDRSAPADEGQPFPPVRAYEEWPAGGPDFAGNIRLSKLESPQDIKRALDATNRRVGFDAATRGRVTQAETERLASELGMTPETLLSRRQGQAFNAEEALRARQLLAKSGNELVNAARRVSALENPGDELLADFRRKWMRHVAIQEQVAGATAEAGRALQQFRMAADSRAVRGDVLNALVRGGGGENNLKDAAETLLDAVEMGPGKFNALAEKAAKPKWRNRISELYINFLLSNPPTHVVNTVSNTLTAMAQIPEHMGASLIGKTRQVFAGHNIDRIVGSEVGARAFGLLQGAKEGARMFARALRTGEPSDFVSKVEGQEYKAIPGRLGEAIRVPTRFLTAEDELFKGIARRMELNGQAVRQAHKEGLKGEAAKRRIAELSANPTDEMLERAMDYGRYLTFQRPLEGWTQDISNAAQKNLFLKLFLPFIRTPTNLLKFAGERSPAAPLLRDWRKDFLAGGARRDLAIAKMMMGTGVGIAIYQAALDGRITGSAPSDPKKARLLYADGWQPYSIKIGDNYYSYKRLDPFSTTLGVAADLATLPEGMSQRQRDDATTLLVASIMGNLASKTWLSGISDVVSALHEPDRYAGNMIERLVGSLLVPAGVAGVARAIDPTARKTDSVGEALKGRVPGMRDDLIPRRDIWGREIKYEGGLGPDFLSPVYTSDALNDPVNQELLKLDYAPGYPSKKVKGVELGPEAYDRYHELSGKLAHQRLADLVTSPNWGMLDIEARVKAAKKTVDMAREEVREELFGGGEGKTSSRSLEAGEVPPPPPGYAIDGESAGRNVYADLKRFIPGLQFTSGYRNEAYQADMRRRGYNPARNSRHLDGSSFDLLPPAGRSMDWLKAQVRKYDPDARMLDEGDHLHVTFPGYFGAPPIGGARNAGLRNPYAQMPPPPPGFTLDAR